MLRSRAPSRVAAPAQDTVVRVVAAGAPLTWLAAGWRDLRRAGWISPAYGLLVALAGFFVTGGAWLLDMRYLITPLIAGFMLVGPVMAVGLYHMSRGLEQGQPVTLAAALLAWRANGFHMLTAGLVLMLILMLWARLSVLVFAIAFPYAPMTATGMVEAALSADGFGFVVGFVALGGAMAALAFAVSVVALPMMLDRGSDFFQAAWISLAVVQANPGAMMLWAGLIAAVTATGLAAGFVGLALTLPVVGHASWHAYRALVTHADRQ